MASILPVAQIITASNSVYWKYKGHQHRLLYSCSGISGLTLEVFCSCNDFSIQMLCVKRHLHQSCNCLSHGCILLSGWVVPLWKLWHCVLTVENRNLDNLPDQQRLGTVSVRIMVHQWPLASSSDLQLVVIQEEVTEIDGKQVNK